MSDMEFPKLTRQQARAMTIYLYRYSNTGYDTEATEVATFDVGVRPSPTMENLASKGLVTRCEWYGLEEGHLYRLTDLGCAYMTSVVASRDANLMVAATTADLGSAPASSPVSGSMRVASAAEPFLGSRAQLAAEIRRDHPEFYCARCDSPLVFTSPEKAATRCSNTECESHRAETPTSTTSVSDAPKIGALPVPGVIGGKP